MDDSCNLTNIYIPIIKKYLRKMSKHEVKAIHTNLIKDRENDL